MVWDRTGGYTPLFYNGYSVMNILNADKASFWIIIDETGKQLFHPQRSPYDEFSPGAPVVAEDVVVLTMPDTNEINNNNYHNPLFYMFYAAKEDCTFYGLDGKPVPELPTDCTMVYPFSDGVSLTCKDALIAGYTRDLMFIDHNGNNAFPH